MERRSLSSGLESQSNSSALTKSVLVCASDQEQLIQRDIYISIVSNSRLLYEALMVPLKAHRSHPIVNHYASDIGIVQAIIHSPSHLVLLDSGIGQNLTITCVQQWRLLRPFPYVVILELKNDTDLILDCIEAGAHAYALQGASSAEIARIIEQVFEEAFQCPSEITAKLFDRLSQPKTVQQPDEKSPLTRRELEVLNYVVKDYSDREIAAQLVIEVRTVKHHIHNILRKLNVCHRWDAARLALRNCWLE